MTHKFEFSIGRNIIGKYEVLAHLGSGLEGEVYLVRELETGVERAAKLFFAKHNPGNRVARAYAKKLHRLCHCDALIQYVNHEVLKRRSANLTLLISEFVDGVVLNQYAAKQRGERLPEFEALRLLYDLAKGLEPIHHAGEYHGDLHGENVMVSRRGIKYEIKLLDFYFRGSPNRAAIEDDVLDMIRLFYDLLGGQQFYSRQSETVKSLCCGLKRSLILKKYRTAGQLRMHLENLQWP